MISVSHYFGCYSKPCLSPFSANYCQGQNIVVQKKGFDSSSFFLKAEPTVALCKKKDEGSTCVFLSGVNGECGGRKADPTRWKR